MEKLVFGESSTAHDWKNCVPQVIERAAGKNILGKMKIALDKFFIYDTLILVDNYAPS
jgi:hypothetical protein